MDNQLRRLWPDPNLSTAAIANEIGVKKNAVIGRAHRIKLGNKPKPPAKPYVRKPRVGGTNKGKLSGNGLGRINRVRSHALTAVDVTIPGAVASPATVITDEPPPDPKGLADLQAGQCHWPVTDGNPYLYCGAQCSGDYCAQHMRMMHRTTYYGKETEQDTQERLAQAEARRRDYKARGKKRALAKA